MILMLALAVLSPESGSATVAGLCIPIASDHLKPTTSDVQDHAVLREALSEPFPQSRKMVMLHGTGGHLSKDEYSIVVTRAHDGVWHGTAVGRSQIAIQDAPFTPMKRKEWVLDKQSGLSLDKAISRKCPFNRAAHDSSTTGAPPLGYISEKIDVVTSGQPTYSFYVGEGGTKIADLIRPPTH